MRYDTMRCGKKNSMRYDKMRCDAVWYDVMRNETIRCGILQKDAIRYDTVRRDLLHVTECKSITCSVLGHAWITIVALCLRSIGQR